MASAPNGRVVAHADLSSILLRHCDTVIRCIGVKLTPGVELGGRLIMSSILAPHPSPVISPMPRPVRPPQCDYGVRLGVSDPVSTLIRILVGRRSRLMTAPGWCICDTRLYLTCSRLSSRHQSPRREAFPIRLECQLQVKEAPTFAFRCVPSYV